MNSEYVTPAEASEVIARWAHREASVIYCEELGDFCIFTQRRGRMELARPGLSIHRAGETCATVFPGRFAEIVSVEADSYEALLLRRPAGASGLEVTLIADFDGVLQPDDVLLMVQADRAVRPPV